MQSWGGGDDQHIPFTLASVKGSILCHKLNSTRKRTKLIQVGWALGSGLWLRFHKCKCTCHVPEAWTSRHLWLSPAQPAHCSVDGASCDQLSHLGLDRAMDILTFPTALQHWTLLLFFATLVHIAKSY